jgi:hypothetical protein
LNLEYKDGKTTVGWRESAAVDRSGTVQEKGVEGDVEISQKNANAFAKMTNSMQWVLDKDGASAAEYAAGRVPVNHQAVMKECLGVALLCNRVMEICIFSESTHPYTH